VRERRAAGAEEVVEGGLLYTPDPSPVGDGEMPVDDEAPREGEEDSAVEAAVEAEKAEAEVAVQGEPEAGAAAPANADTPEQPAADAADEAAPADGDREQG
jgi:hypothetical protein